MIFLAFKSITKIVAYTQRLGKKGGIKLYTMLFTVIVQHL